MGEPSLDGRANSSLGMSPTLPAMETASGAEAALAGAAVQRDVRAQLRLFAWLVLAAVFASAGILLFAGGDPLAKKLILGAAAMTIVAYAGMLLITRRRSWYQPRVIAWMGVAAFVPTAAALYYFGVLSPYPMVTAFGIYTYARAGQSAVAAFATYLTCAMTHGALAGLMMAGVLDDVGLISSRDIPVSHHLPTHLGVQVFYLLCYAMGVLSNRATRQINVELEEAVRTATRREALLAEAQLRLEQAAGVGQPGPYSGHVLGSFRLGKIIGRGAMGEVYEATADFGGQPVAVKVLHGHLLANQEHRVRFARETRATQAIESEHVVSVLEVSGPDDAVPYLAMERLHGRDLSEILRDGPELTSEELSEMVAQLARGLEAAWGQQVVHRDLKPQNIFRVEGQRPSWKILDFGVSKLISQQATQTGGALLGTPTYMAPEQVTSDSVDHRTDVYALGAICYRVLTGKPPFSGTSLVGVMRKVLDTMPAAPNLGDDRAQVELVLALALAKRQVDRFATAGELASALGAAFEGTLDERVRERGRAVLRRNPWNG